jgi:hypothetical protein
MAGAIDRERVRRLAARRSPRARLVDFLAHAEPITDALEALAGELEEIRSNHGADGFGRLLWHCTADARLHRLFARDPGPAEVVFRLLQTAEHLAVHEDIVRMRLRTRGQMSDDRADLDDRLRHVRNVLYRFIRATPRLRLHPLFQKYGHLAEIRPPRRCTDPTRFV